MNIAAACDDHHLAVTHERRLFDRAGDLRAPANLAGVRVDQQHFATHTAHEHARGERRRAGGRHDVERVADRPPGRSGVGPGVATRASEWLTAASGASTGITQSRPSRASTNNVSPSSAGAPRSEEHTSELQSHSFISYA